MVFVYCIEANILFFIFVAYIHFWFLYFHHHVYYWIIVQMQTFYCFRMQFNYWLIYSIDIIQRGHSNLNFFHEKLSDQNLFRNINKIELKLKINQLNFWISYSWIWIIFRNIRVIKARRSFRLHILIWIKK